ncbi:MAG: hypothetical protein PHV12_07595 [Bacteroidales bacterium]|nr:hypothetical protein [Bacteroidales bacterium]
MFIPGYILLDNVKWENHSDNSVRGTLNGSGIEVSGIFYFNDDGLFTRFETEDRFYTMNKSKYKKVKFSVIVEGYKEQGMIKCIIKEL